MDEVPIPNNNPVFIKTKVTQTKPKKKSRLLETLKNFIFMFPLAMVICYQLYSLGYRFGEFITFPPTSVTSYIFIGCLLLMLLVIQILMRSIIYAVLVGIFFLAGIFSAWFGPIYDPIVNNLSSITEIIKSAWTRKDIPFQLLVTGSMSCLFAAIIFSQFILSLLVKSFFELIFGKNWGDGKWMGYVGAIALIFGIHISFNSYHKYSNDNKEKLIWKYYQTYTPLEKFVTRTPGSVSYNENYIWVNNGNKVLALNIENGKVEGEKIINSEVICKGISKSHYPIVATKERFIILSPTLETSLFEIVYPYKYDPSDENENQASDTAKLNSEVKSEISENNTEDKELLIPLTYKMIDEETLLAFFEYGKMGLYNITNGTEMWCNKIESSNKINRIFPDKYLDEISYLVNNKKLIVSCKNGFVKSIDIKTGKTDWTYEHSVARIGGKPQLGYLSKNDDRSLVVSFKTGEIVTLGYKDGHVIHKAINEKFAANNASWCNERKAHFITDEGLYYEIQLDGGNIENRINALPNKAEFYPMIQDNENGIYAHRENIYHVSPEDGFAKLIFTSKNRTFVTKPVFVGKTMYIGTQDGWIYCIHYGSSNVKWVCHTDGELMEDSFAISDKKLIVKTKSDSIYVFDKDYVQ